jgi:hypothetical protein
VPFSHRHDFSHDVDSFAHTIHFFVFVCSSSFDLLFLKVAQFNDSALQRVFSANGGSAQVLPSGFQFLHSIMKAAKCLPCLFAIGIVDQLVFLGPGTMHVWRLA